MFREISTGIAVLSLMAGFAWAQDRRPLIDVEHYVIEAEINPSTQSLVAKVEVRFKPLEHDVASAVFELNNALNLSKVEDAEGRQLPASRSRRDFAVRLSFPEPLLKDQPASVTFHYDGVLTGSEESPVWGIRFAAIHKDYAYLLYPARWFPVSGYTTDRYTAELNIKVPAGDRVVASGIGKETWDGTEHMVFSFSTSQPAFPGSIAVVREDPLRVAADGGISEVYFRGQQRDLAGVYVQETIQILSQLSNFFGLPAESNLTLVQTEAGAPNAYSVGGILFLSPRVITDPVNSRVLANQIARQWWGTLVSPETRDHMWITNGAARYAELLQIEQTRGASDLENEVRDTYIEALTVSHPPMIQASRLEDYSPEFWALTAGKGAATFHMLRYVMGEDNFRKLMKQLPEQYAWQPVNTGNLRRLAEEITGNDLQYFFIQWAESTGAPEFRLEYTIFRTQSGFRVMGKVTQDLDTFRMPVDLRIETEGNPEDKRVEVVGTSSEFIVETFGRPRLVSMDPHNRVLRYDNRVRVAVAIRRGEQFAEIGEFGEALKEYQKALEVDRYNSLAHYRVAEVFFLQNNYQSAANSFREALNGNLEPAWVEVWSHINLGYIFDITGQRERAMNEYRLAIRTKDNTQGAQEVAALRLNEPYERQARADR